jgi:branched-chain amino acid transport system substrate-binding protein
MRSLLRRIMAIAAALLTVSAVASAADQPPIRIGIIYRYSGGGPPMGKSLDAAIAAYQNLHGDSVAGRKIEFIRRDDGGVAPDVARRLAQELIVGEKVDALYGLLFTPNAIAVGSVSTAAKMPVFVTNAATSELLPNNPYMVRFSLTETQVAAPLGVWAAKNGIKTAYTIYLDYGAGHEADEAFKKAFTANGGKIVGDIAAPLTTETYVPYAQRIKDAKPDAVFAMVGPINGGQGWVKAYAEAGLAAAGIKFLATNDLTTGWNLPLLGDNGVGIISASNYASSFDTPANKSFVKAFQTAFGSAFAPDFEAAAAYDAVDAIYRVVKAQNGKLDPDRTIALLKGMKFDSPRGPIVIDPQTRDVVQNIYIFRTEKHDGTYVNVKIATLPMIKENGLP